MTDKVQTSDGFLNLIQRAGYGAQNSFSAGTYSAYELLSRNRIKLEWMYRQSWLVGAMVDSVAEDMTRAGIEINCADDPAVEEELAHEFAQLQVWDSLLDTIKWARLYGGAIAVVQIAGQALETPLRLETVTKDQFEGLSVFDRWQLQPDLTRLIKSGPQIGLPEFYRVVSSYGTNGTATEFNTLVHHTRCIRMIGIKLPAYQAMTEQMWGESVVERVYDRLLGYDTANAGVTNLLDKAHLRMVGIQDLREIFSMGGPAEENLLKMFKYVREMQSIEGITLLDKEDVWQTSSYSFAGMSDVLLQFGQQISGATGIPLVRLFGQSPSGLNSTGESDLRMYYDNINAQQESRLRAPLDQLIKVIYQSVYGKPAPDGLSFTFAPLWQTSTTEKVANAKALTETVVGAYDAGLIPLHTAMQELRQAAAETGIYTNITDEQINEAEANPPEPVDELELAKIAAGAMAGEEEQEQPTPPEVE